MQQKPVLIQKQRPNNRIDRFAQTTEKCHIVLYRSSQKSFIFSRQIKHAANLYFECYFTMICNLEHVKVIEEKDQVLFKIQT